jgi:hypothetical protein
VSIDWRALEDGLLRRELKAKSFRELYGGGSAERGPIVERTGRMTVVQPTDLGRGAER